MIHAAVRCEGHLSPEMLADHGAVVQRDAPLLVQKKAQHPLAVLVPDGIDQEIGGCAAPPIAFR